MRTILLLALLLPISGCAMNRTSWWDGSEDRREAYIRSHPDLDPVVAINIRQGVVSIGMTEEQVIATWGKPHDGFATSGSEKKAFSYPDHGYLIEFDNGLVKEMHAR